MKIGRTHRGNPEMELDLLIPGIQGGFYREHDTEGRHGAVTASSLAVEGAATLRGAVTFAQPHGMTLPTRDIGRYLRTWFTGLDARGGVVDLSTLRGSFVCSVNPFIDILGTGKPITLLLGDVLIDTSVTWIIPQKCRVIGMDRGDNSVGCTIRAAATFSSDYENSATDARAAVVVLGDLNPASHGVSIENVAVSANAIADYCIYSENVNELGGVIHCPLYNALVDCCFIEHTASGSGSGSPQNFVLRELEIMLSNAAVPATATGLRLSLNTAVARGVDGITVNGDGADSGGGIDEAIVLEDAPGFYARLHVEHATDGVVIDGNGVILAYVDGTPSCTNVVRVLSGQDYTLLSVTKGSSTNVLKDDVLSITLTATSLGFYSVGQGTPGANAFLTTARVTRQQFRTRVLELSGETASATGLRFLDSETPQWILQRSANNTDFQVRSLTAVSGAGLTRFVLDESTGYSSIGSDDGGASVRINSIANHGTGGLEVYSGGASPTLRHKFHGDGNVDFLNLPTADPSEAGRLWNDSGTLKVSAG